LKKFFYFKISCLPIFAVKISEMNTQYPYVTKLDVRYKQLEIIDIPMIIEECRHQWYNESLCLVNSSVVRIGIVEGEYHWHFHEKDDEFFLVLQGELIVDTREKSFVLKPFQGITIPKGMLHRTRAEVKTVMMMVENKEIIPTGEEKLPE